MGTGNIVRDDERSEDKLLERNEAEGEERDGERNAPEKELKEDEDDNDDVDNDDDGVPLDSGYSWVVCFCAFYCNMAIFANNRCLATLFVDIREEFGESQTVTSLTFTSFSLMFGVSTVLASNVLLRFVEQRTACFVAAATSSVALFVSTHSPNIGVWLLAYACRGLCCGCLLLIPMSMIGQYFKRRRALASSIASMGMVLSNIAFPPLVTLLNQVYGLRGALLLISCFELQMIPISMLLRSPATYKERHRRRQKLLIELKQEQQQQQYQQQKSNKQASPAHAPTTSFEILPPRDEDVSRQNGSHLDMELIVPNQIPSPDNNGYLHPPTNEDMGFNSPRANSAPAVSYLNSQKSYSCLDDNTDMKNLDEFDNNEIEIKPLRHRLLPLRTLSDQGCATSGANTMSLAALGSLVNVSYVVKNDDEIDDKDEYDDEIEEEDKICKQLCRLETFIDVKLMKSWVFLMVTVAVPFSATTNFLSMYIPVFTEMVDISRERASLLLSIGGAVDLITRGFTGWFADKNVITKEKMIASSLLVVAILCQFGRFFTTFPHFVIFVVISGIFSGFRSNLYIALLYDLFGKEKAPKAFGMGLLVTTTVMAVNHPVVGGLVDATQYYTIPMHYIGAILALCSFLLMLKPVFVKWDRQREEERTNNAVADS